MRAWDAAITLRRRPLRARGSGHRPAHVSAYPHPLIAREGWPYIAIAIVAALIVSVVAGMAWAFPFWVIVAELDFLEREPITLRLVAFAWGGLVATSVSIPGSAALENLVAKLGSARCGAGTRSPTRAPAG